MCMSITTGWKAPTTSRPADLSANSLVGRSGWWLVRSTTKFQSKWEASTCSEGRPERMPEIA